MTASILNMIGRSAVTTSDLMRVSHSWTPKLNILEILKYFDLHRSPVDRQPLIIWTLCFLCLPCLPLPVDSGNIKAWSCTAVATVLCQIWGLISLKSGTSRVKMSYSEVGPSNGQISQRLIDTGLNHSASIPIWSGDLQLQGLTLCGSVSWIEYSWNFNTWPASEPCRQATITDMDFMFPVPTLPFLT